MRMRHGIITLFGSVFVFWSRSLCAQPPTNPAVFGRGNDWLAFIGILFFTCPLVWVLSSRFGYYLSGKTNKPFWERLWRDYFMIIGSIAWIVLVFAFFAL